VLLAITFISFPRITAESVIILALRFHNSLHIPSGIVLFELRYL
jgi:hypothetical protein